jgi:hypothetical protein
MLLQVPDHSYLEGRAVVRIEIATADQVLRKATFPIARPGPDGGDEFRLVDQAELVSEEPDCIAASPRPMVFRAPLGFF